MLKCGPTVQSREGVRGVAGVAAATPFFEPEKIRNFVISFLRLIRLWKKKSCYTIFKILTPSLYRVIETVSVYICIID